MAFEFLSVRAGDPLKVRVATAVKSPPASGTCVCPAEWEYVLHAPTHWCESVYSPSEGLEAGLPVIFPGVS